MRCPRFSHKSVTEHEQTQSPLLRGWRWGWLVQMVCWKPKLLFMSRPLFSCGMMVAPIRQRCVIAWVRHAEHLFLSLFVRLHITLLITGASHLPAPPPESWFSLSTTYVCLHVCLSLIVCICAHFTPISYLLILLSHYLSICLQSITALLPWLHFGINHAEGRSKVKPHTVQWGIYPIHIDYIVMVY